MSRKPATVALAAVLVAAALPASVALAGKGRGASSKGQGIAVQNLRGETVQVVIDGELMGMLPPQGRAAFPASAGRHMLELQDVEGDAIMKRKVRVEDGERRRIRLHAGDGQVELRNDSGLDQVVYVTDRDGKVRHQLLRDGQAIALTVAPGEVSLQTSRTWFDVRMSLSSQELMVAPGSEETIRLPAVEEALVRVENRGDEAIVLFQEDERLGYIGPETTGFIRAPVGSYPVRVTLDGMDALERPLNVDAEDGARLTFDIRKGTVQAINESYRPARVFVDGRSYGWMRPGESRTFEVPVGHREVSFVGRGGEVYDARKVRVRMTEDQRLVLRPDRHRPEADDDHRGAHHRRTKNHHGSYDHD